MNIAVLSKLYIGGDFYNTSIVDMLNKSLILMIQEKKEKSKAV